jgi:hypothetical protein
VADCRENGNCLTSVSVNFSRRTLHYVVRQLLVHSWQHEYNNRGIESGCGVRFKAVCSGDLSIDCQCSWQA